MPESPDRTALYRLYSTKRPEGLPPFLEELYPKHISSLHYMGTAGSCRNGGPGISYRPFDWESDNCVALEVDIHWGIPQTPVPTALYRLHGQDGTLLYIGIAYDPEARWAQHQCDKPWWPLVAGRSLAWFPNRDRALEAEAHAIRTERPLHNFQHNQSAAA